jgi:BirA family biotin operon repressor/biotin-[acetyl-CoA-carboxylase] ligase
MVDGTGRVPVRWDVRRYDTVDSTNSEAARLLRVGAGPGLVVTARHQTGGRGRLGRRWLDVPGKSLLVSVVMEGSTGVEAAMLLSLSARAAVVRKGGKGPSFKWPNDLVYGKRKLGGVLCESCVVGKNRYIVAGVGINVSCLPEELEVREGLPPTSLLVEEGRLWDRDELLRDLLEELASRWGGSGEEWRREYLRHQAYMGRLVRVKPPYCLEGEVREEGVPVEGVMEGVDEEGRLVLLHEGRRILVSSGDVLPVEGRG